MNFTLTSNRFPDGTSVGAYPVTLGAPFDFDAAPTVAAVDSQIVAGNRVVFTALPAGRYFAYALVGGEHRYVGFSVQPQAGESLVVTKTVDQSVNNNASTFVDDEELRVSLPANSEWMFELHLDLVGASVTADIRLNFTVPTGGAIRFRREIDSVGPGSTPTPLLDGTSDEVLGLDANESMQTVRGWVTAGATPGELIFKWQQNTAVAEDVTVKAGSIMRLIRVA